MVQLRPHYERPSQVAAEHTELLAAIADGDPAARRPSSSARTSTEAVQNLSSALAAGEGRMPRR